MSIRPELYLIINNISKKNNVRTLITSAVAFGGSTNIIIVGQPHFEPSIHVPPPFRDKITLARYPTLEACREDLQSRGIKIFGVEISEEAHNIEDEPFDGPSAFLMGNEGSGMNQRQARNCDGFIYISQYGLGTSSLNVAVAASIVMHRFSIWSQGQGMTGKKPGRSVDVDR